MRVALNGFGRIGRTFLRCVLQDPVARKKLDIVSLNIGPANADWLEVMFKYDTLMGIFPGKVEYRDCRLIVDGQAIEIIAECDPCKIDWKSRNVDWVVEATGMFTSRIKSMEHIQAGAKNVLITAPTKDDLPCIVMGINQDTYNPNDPIVSLGSCTTWAFLPMLKVLNDKFAISNGFMTTIHAYTNTQILLDKEDSTIRRSRAAALNIIPTTTGATSALPKVLPELTGKIKARAMRVPVGIVSLIDLVATVEKKPTISEINQAYAEAAQKYMKGYVAISNEPLVSSDYKGNGYSVTIDGLSTDVISNTVKLLGWYDNEWGYSQRLKDFLLLRT